MAEWRAGALKNPPGSRRHCTAQGSVSRCRRGGCDTCSSRLRRAARLLDVDQAASIGMAYLIMRTILPRSECVCRCRHPPQSFPPRPPCLFDAAEKYSPPSVGAPAVNLVKDFLCTSCASAWLEADQARQGKQAAVRAASEADARARHLEVQIKTTARHLHLTPAFDVCAVPPLTSPVWVSASHRSRSHVGNSDTL